MEYSLVDFVHELQQKNQEKNIKIKNLKNGLSLAKRVLSENEYNTYKNTIENITLHMNNKFYKNKV